MLAIGGLLVCAALLTVAALVPVFHRSDPPQWTTRGWVGEVVTIAIVCTMALGIGYLGAGAIAAVQTGPDYLDIGLLAGVLFASVMIRRKLKVRARPSPVVVAVSVPASGDGVAPAEPVPVITPPRPQAA